MLAGSRQSEEKWAWQLPRSPGPQTLGLDRENDVIPHSACFKNGFIPIIEVVAVVAGGVVPARVGVVVSGDDVVAVVGGCVVAVATVR